MHHKMFYNFFSIGDPLKFIPFWRVRFGVPKNKILLHFGVPDNCSSGPGMARRIYSLSTCRGHQNGVKFACRGHRNGVKKNCLGHSNEVKKILSGTPKWSKISFLKKD